MSFLVSLRLLFPNEEKQRPQKAFESLTDAPKLKVSERTIYCILNCLFSDSFLAMAYLEYLILTASLGLLHSYVGSVNVSLAIIYESGLISQPTRVIEMECAVEAQKFCFLGSKTWKPSTETTAKKLCATLAEMKKPRR